MSKLIKKFQIPASPIDIMSDDELDKYLNDLHPEFNDPKYSITPQNNLDIQGTFDRAKEWLTEEWLPNRLNTYNNLHKGELENQFDRVTSSDIPGIKIYNEKFYGDGNTQEWKRDSYLLLDNNSNELKEIKPNYNKILKGRKLRKEYNRIISSNPNISDYDLISSLQDFIYDESNYKLKRNYNRALNSYYDFEKKLRNNAYTYGAKSNYIKDIQTLLEHPENSEYAKNLNAGISAIKNAKLLNNKNSPPSDYNGIQTKDESILYFKDNPNTLAYTIGGDGYVYWNGEHDESSPTNFLRTMIHELNHIGQTYYGPYKNNYGSYWSRNHEIGSRIKEFFHSINADPNHIYTLDEILKLRKLYGGDKDHYQLFNVLPDGTELSDYDLLDMFNNYAYNDMNASPSSTVMAKKGTKLIRKGESGLDFSKAKTWEDIFNLINTDSRFRNRTYEQKVQSAKALLKEILGGRFYSNGVSKPIGRSIELEEKPIQGVSNEVSPSLVGQQVKLNIDLNEPVIGDKKLNTPVVINNKELTTPIVIREAVTTSLPSFLDWFTPKTPSVVSAAHSAIEEPKVLPLTNENAILSIGRLIPRPVTKQDVLKNPVKPVTPIIDVEKPVMIEYNGLPVLETRSVTPTVVEKTPEEISRLFLFTASNIVAPKIEFKPITVSANQPIRLNGNSTRNSLSLVSKLSNPVKPVSYNEQDDGTIKVSDFDANLSKDKIITNNGKAARNYLSVASNTTPKKVSEKLPTPEYTETNKWWFPTVYTKSSDGSKYFTDRNGNKFNVNEADNLFSYTKKYFGFKQGGKLITRKN